MSRHSITNGTTDTAHPNIGLLLVGAEGGTAKTVCTATLVGRQTLLTSTHCLKDEPNNFFRMGGRMHVVESFVRRADWDPATSLHLNDIGLVRLEAPIDDVELAPLANRPPDVGEQVTLVGFGVTASDLEVPDAGTKRVAINFVDAAGERDFEISGTGEGEGNICAGDSGGPALAVIDGREVVVGVASATEDPCGQRAWYVAVSAYRGWLASESQGEIEPAPDGGVVPDQGASEIDLGDMGIGENGSADEPAGPPSEGCRVAAASARGGGASPLGLGFLALLALGFWRRRR